MDSKPVFRPPELYQSDERTTGMANGIHARTGSVIEVLAALGSLSTTYLEFGYFPWYPTWLYVGPVTFPTVAGLPVVLSIIVLVRWRRGPGRDTTGGTVLAGVAALTLLGSLYAIWNLNVVPGGVFWAGFLPLIGGAFLALVVLLTHVIGVFQRNADAYRTE